MFSQHNLQHPRHHVTRHSVPGSIIGEFTSKFKPNESLASDNHKFCPSNKLLMAVVFAGCAETHPLHHHIAHWDMLNQRMPLLIEQFGHAHQINGNQQENVCITNLNLARPSIVDAKGNLRPVYPHECVIQELPYGVPVFSTILHIVSSQSGEPLELNEYRNAMLGNGLPWMTGSSLCNTVERPIHDFTPKIDYGGTFITSKGKERYIVPEVTRGWNQIFVFPSTQPHATWIAECRPKERRRHRSASTMYLYWLADVERIAVAIPFTKECELPLFAVFRMLGVRTIAQASRMILTMGATSGLTPIPADSVFYDEELEARVRGLLYSECGQSGYRLKTGNSLEAANFILKLRKEGRLGRATHTRVLDAYPGVDTAAGMSEKDIEHICQTVPDFEHMSMGDTMDWAGLHVQREEKTLRSRQDREHNMRGLLVSELFPHIGTKDFPSTWAVKRRYLAYMTWRLLMVAVRGLDSNDRSDLATKHLESGAHKVLVKASQTVRRMMYETNSEMDARPKNNGHSFMNVAQIMSAKSFTAEMNEAINSGDFSAKRKADGHTNTNATQLLNRQNPLATLSDMRGFKKDIPANNKKAELRDVHPSEEGFIDPSNSTENTNAGLTQFFSLLATAIPGLSNRTIYNYIEVAYDGLLDRPECVRPGNIAFDARCKPKGFCIDPRGNNQNVSFVVRLNEENTWGPEAAMDEYIMRHAAPDVAWLTINGSPFRLILQGAVEYAAALRQARRRGRLPADVSVAYLPSRAELRVDAEEGGFRTPMFVFEELGFAGCIKRARRIMRSAQQGNISRPWQALLHQQCVEYVSPLEKQSLHCRFNTLKTPFRAGIPCPPPYTHGYIHPITLNSDAILRVVMFVMNQSPRNTFAKCMMNGAIGPYVAALFRTTSMQLAYAQTPLVHSAADTMHPMGGPMGLNVPTMTIISDGNNQEDSIEVSQRFVDLGGFAILMHQSTSHTITLHRKKEIVPVFAKPTGKVLDQRAVDFSALDNDGLPFVGEKVSNHHAIIGRVLLPETACTVDAKQSGPHAHFVTPATTEAVVQSGVGLRVAGQADDTDFDKELQGSESGLPLMFNGMRPPAEALEAAQEASIIPKIFYGTARITAAMRTLKGGPCMTEAVRTTQIRLPQPGDKFASRLGQKGVIGAIRRTEDCPQTENGMIPCIMLSNIGQYARMTTAMQDEFLQTMLATHTGNIIDGTAFCSLSSDQVRSALRATKSITTDGTLNAVDGFSGVRLANKVEFGFPYYERQRHMVADKLAMRTDGQLNGQTRQPNQGRINNGGLKIGTMETDCIKSSGAAALLQERFNQADKCMVIVCRKCGLFGVPGHEDQGFSVQRINNRPYCRNCSSYTTVENVWVPFCTVLLSMLLMSASIATRLRLEDEDKQDYTHPSVGVLHARSHV